MDWCSPDPAQTVITFHLENTGDQWMLCESFCDFNADCSYWSLYSKGDDPSCLCSLFANSYLHTCEVVSGGLAIDIVEVILYIQYSFTDFLITAS